MEACLFKLALTIIWSLWQHYKWTQQFCSSDVMQAFGVQRNGRAFVKNMHPCIWQSKSKREMREGDKQLSSFISHILSRMKRHWWGEQGKDIKHWSFCIFHLFFTVIWRQPHTPDGFVSQTLQNVPLKIQCIIVKRIIKQRGTIKRFYLTSQDYMHHYMHQTRLHSL